MNDNMRSKMERLQELVVDKLIEELEEGNLKAMDLQSSISLLNNNKIHVKGEDAEEGVHNKVKRLIKKTQE